VTGGCFSQVVFMRYSARKVNIIKRRVGVCEAMYTIGKLAHEFHISRSTLLYYDSIGLLTPSARDANKYRMYSDEDYKRLAKIMVYREAGISLEKIHGILNAEQTCIVNELQQRLKSLNEEINLLRQQQCYIKALLEQVDDISRHNVEKLKVVIGIMEATGVTEETRWTFHNHLETAQPDCHQAFLEMLGLSPDEIKHCREWAINKMF
jgi:DNA-binding transcriptional MerR regulator